MSVIVVIPARYSSTRFPGKPLAPLKGIPMIEHVYRNASNSRLADEVVVATDSEVILEKVLSFGGKAVMTSPDHVSGTDRIAEVARGLHYDIIVNVQGDEPLIRAEMIDDVVSVLDDRGLGRIPAAQNTGPDAKSRKASTNNGFGGSFGTMSSHPSSPQEARPSAAADARSAAPVVDVWERTKGHTGPAQAMNRRLFMQLYVLECPAGESPTTAIDRLSEALTEQDASAVIYEDANNPHAIGVMSWSEDPADFLKKVRPAFSRVASSRLTMKPDFTMLGRSYSTGYEPDLEYWLIHRPIETVTNPEWPWAVWYPLRRSGAFARLPAPEQGAILREHAEIGKAYGNQDLAHDVRLACHGLDAKDNEFVIGLIGKELHPLSHVVQSMRKTRQTSEFIVQMGPFFVGYSVFRHVAE